MPAKSKKQQRFFGLVHAYQQGKIKNPSEDVKRVADSISASDAEHFAKTKHDGLPEKAAEWLKSFKEAQIVEIDPGRRINASKRAKKILDAIMTQAGDDEELERRRKELEDQNKKDVAVVKQNADTLAKALDVVRGLVGDRL